jgi:hypothetical protein
MYAAALTGTGATGTKLATMGSTPMPGVQISIACARQFC